MTGGPICPMTSDGARVQFCARLNPKSRRRHSLRHRPSVRTCDSSAWVLPRCLVAGTKRREKAADMEKPRLVERVAVSVCAFLMIAFGIGVLVTVGLREIARFEQPGLFLGYGLGTHALFIIIPGFVGLFVVLGCGCCNTRPAYATSLVFDINGLLLYIAAITVLAIFLDTPLMAWDTSTECTYVQGNCTCVDTWYPSDYPIGQFANRCERDATLISLRSAVYCMWAFSLLFTIIHLVLVAHLSFALTTVTPDQELNAPGQNVIPMQTMAPQGPAQVYVPPPGAYPRQPLPSIHQHQPTSVQGPPQVDVTKTSPAAEQSQDTSLKAPVQVGEVQTSSLTA